MTMLLVQLREVLALCVCVYVRAYIHACVCACMREREKFGIAHLQDLIAHLT